MQGSVRWLAHVVALCLGLAGLGCAVALPFAPVMVEKTQVHWPSRTGETDSPTTTALFAPYRPADFVLTVPCPVQRVALERPAPTTVLTTLPEGSDRQGLTLSTRDGQLRLLLGKREVPLPTSCGLTVRAGDGHTTITPERSPRIELPGVSAPEIFTFATDLTGPQIRGLTVDARTFSWFDTSPTQTKRDLTTDALVLAAVSLVLLFAHAPPALSRVRLRPTLLIIDVAVTAVIGNWLVIGPLTDDDGFAMMTVRNYDAAGDIDNYYRWFNASETPFTLVQHLMRWVAADDLAPVWLRLPSAIAGLATWILLSRGIVAPLCRGSRRFPLHLVTSVFFLACWLPYGVGIRPEPFVALGFCAQVTALLKSSRSRAPFGWLGVAALATGLTAAITPTGVGVVLVLVVFAPRIIPVLGIRGVLPRWLSVPTRVALLAAVGSVGLVPMFADSTWNGVRQATWVHDQFGPSFGWYQEVERYASLLAANSMAWNAAGKRVVVLLVLVAVLLSGACAVQQLHRWTKLDDLPLLLGATLSIFAALWLTPSKWTHHFGALAGLGPALLTVTVVLLVRVGRLTDDRSDAQVLGVLGTGAGAVAAGLAFSGPNAWPAQSDWAMPWSDTPVRPDVPLDHPLFWLLCAFAVAALTLVALRIARRLRGHPLNGLMWTVPPSAVLTGAALASVLVLLGSFTAAPEVMGNRFSMARMNRQALDKPNCGLEDEVQALPISETLLPLPGSQAVLNGFVAGGGAPPEPDLRLDSTRLRAPAPEDPNDPLADEVRPRSASDLSWTSQDPPNTGELTSPWFGLGRVGPRQTLAVWVAGRTEQGNSLTLEFARGSRTARVRAVTDPPPTSLPFADPKHGRPRDWRVYSSWRLATVDARDIPPGADRVRIHASDRSTDPQGSLHVSGPAIRDVVGLRQALDQQGPTLIDWPMSFVFPCRTDYPRVSHGTAASPRMLITPPEGEASMAYDPAIGGVFAGTQMLSRRLELPTRLRDAPGLTWGHLVAVRYERERDQYETSVRRTVIGGTEGDGSYPFDIYEGKP